MIELADVSFGYEGIPVLSGINLTVHRGEIICLKGKSGCGKSTLLHILSGFCRPYQGRPCLDGRAYSVLPYEKLRSSVVYLHQTPVMLSGIPVLDNLMTPFGFRVNKGKTRPTEEELIRLLASFHLEPGILVRDAGSLSVGEQQRVAILRACVLHPDFLLLDEPLANLDAESAQAIQEWIIAQSREETGLVIASHQPLPGLSQSTTRVLEIRGQGLHEQRD